MSSSASFNLSGVEKLQRAILDKAKSIRSQAEDALRLEGEFVRTDAMMKVPIDEGSLRASAHLVPEEGVNTEGDVISVSVSFGGASAPYASAIHEYPERHSPPSWEKAESVEFGPGDRGPKYLSRAMDEAEDGMTDRIAEKIEI
jgi:hypothetical protein